MKKPSLMIRVAARVFRSVAPPLSRIADELSRLNANLERDMAARGVPQIPDEREVEKLASERGVTEIREEWEIAVEEEVLRRREAEDREIADRVAERMGAGD